MIWLKTCQDVDPFLPPMQSWTASLEMGKNLLQLFLFLAQLQAAAEAYPRTSGWPVYTAIVCAIISVFKGLLVSSVPLIWAQFSPRKSPPRSPSCSSLSRWSIWELLSLQPSGKPTCVTFLVQVTLCLAKDYSLTESCRLQNWVNARFWKDFQLLCFGLLDTVTLCVNNVE